MRVQSIRASNYLNHRAMVIEVPAEARAVVLAGPNGAGKTGLIEAMRLILTGDLPRGFGYKKDLPQLITEGEKDGWVGATLCTDEGRAVEYKVGLKTGAASAPPPLTAENALAVAPQLFMQMDPNKRRRALLTVYGVSLKQPDVLAQLEADGHAAERLARIKTALGGGFDTGAKRAKELASEARGSWQAITGETYGAKKAEDWKAPLQTFDNPGDPKAIAFQLAEKQEAVAKAVRKRDEARRDEQQHQGAEKARQQAEGLKRAEHALASHDEQIELAKAKYAQLRDAATSPGGWTAPCPCCGKVLKSEKAGHLVEYDPGAAAGPRAMAMAEAASTTLSSLQGERARLAKAADNARAAKLMLERLPARPEPGELEAYEADARTLTDELRVLEQEHENAKAALVAEATAARLTEDAARYHEDVAAYGELAVAVEGLPAKFLSATLERVNEALDHVSRAFSSRVHLGNDMELRYGTVPYRLLSESQQWRADLALGLALAQQTRAPVLMDRFDMVQLSDRGAILQMLATQTWAQVVVGATLKADPAFPAESGLFSHWLGG